MRVSVDISLYPLTESYVEPILRFIERLEANPKLQVVKNSLSTQVFGDYADVMAAMDTEIEAVFAVLPDSVFVLKLVGQDRYPVTDA